MRLMFVYWAFEDQGSGLLIQGYTQAARALGHEVVVYGRPNPKIPLNYSLDIDAADAVLFIFEWTTKLMRGDTLDWVRLLEKVPRRRVILDGDGNYNDLVCVGGDYNHKTMANGRHWRAVCDSLTDKVCQPTFHPLRPNVGTHFFHAYHPGWEVPLDFRAKEFGLYYVGNNWFRWRSVRKVLKAVEPIRDRVGRVGMVGHGWDVLPPWANASISADAYASEPEYLKKLNVEVGPPVHFKEVFDHMSKGVIHPVVYRPLFNHLQLVTCRTFETFAANTIPLFGQDEAYVAEFYGPAAGELVLPAERPETKIEDMLRRPNYYAEIVRDVRRLLNEKHSYAVRLRELIEIVER